MTLLHKVELVGSPIHSPLSVAQKVAVLFTV